MKFADLKKPFPPEDIRWRISRAGYSGKDKKKIWCRVLAYVTSRATQERLDEVCGPEKWRNEYAEGPGGGVLCGLSIKVGDEWVTKWDGADNTKFEAVKGGLSGAQKRAGYQWGIARYLYNLEEDFGFVLTNGEHSGSFKDKDTGKEIFFKYNPPDLPKWALPEGYKPDENKETFEELKKELVKTTTEEVLVGWYETNKQAANDLLSGSWLKMLRKVFDEHMEHIQTVKEKETTEARGADTKDVGTRVAAGGDIPFG